MSEVFPEYTESVGTCEECGNSPVNHSLVRFSNNIDLLIAYFSNRADQHRQRKKTWVRMQAIEDWVTRVFFSVGHTLGLIRFGDEPKDAKSYRSRVIWEEAIRRSIPMQQVILSGIKTDTYRAKINGIWVYFESLPVPNEYKSPSTVWVDDKVALKRKLSAHGIPVPRSEGIRTYEPAKRFVSELGMPVVVKPRIGTRGRHTTVYVKDAEDLREALSSARVLCSYASVEEYLPGSICRGTVIDGKLVGFFQADPLVVMGDGISSLEKLIAKANDSREDRVAPAVVTSETKKFLERLGYAMESIPATGTHIPIGHRTGRLFGGSTRELLETVHPRLRERLESAADVLKISIVGFDLVIQNPEADPDTQRWGIIEANTLPFIDLHYLPLHGKPSNPAAAVWDLWR
jgi:D-alanine-D-alanine ligase-like ATP-grasp enzyme